MIDFQLVFQWFWGIFWGFIDSDDPFQLLSNVRLLLLMKTDLNSLSSFTTVWFALFCCNVLFERLMIWWRSVKIRCYLLNYSLGKFFFLVRNLWRNDYYAALRLTLNLFFSLLFDIAFGTGWKKKESSLFRLNFTVKDPKNLKVKKEKFLDVITPLRRCQINCFLSAWLHQVQSSKSGHFMTCALECIWLAGM